MPVSVGAAAGGPNELAAGVAAARAIE
eukprot:SAG11_NODE_22370_length_407_cov_0.844156_1_plen_26_part_01